MRLLFVVQRYGDEVVGGAERYVADLATGLAAEGHEVSVLSSCATSYETWANVYPSGRSVEHGVTVHRLPVRAPRDNARFLPLHLRAVDARAVPLWPWAQDRWSQLMGPDLEGAEAALRALVPTVDVTVFVGYHYAPTLRLVRTAAAMGPVAVVPTAHPEGAFLVGRVRQMFEHADRVVCLAPEEGDLVADVHGCRAKVRVAPCPVDPLVRPSDDRVDAVLRAHGLERDRYVVVVGRVDPAKGSDDAVRFSAEFRRLVDPDLRLVVVGPGGSAAATADGGTVCTGFVDDDVRNALVAGSLALVQPSYMESFSLALIEGWLLGRPALVQGRSAVLAGHVERSGGGLAYRDYRSFELGLATLATRRDVAGLLADRGRRYALEQFSWTTASQAFLRALDGIGRPD